MDDLAYLQSRVPDYADYADEDHRHLVDRQIRAVLGEALAAVQARLSPSGTDGESLSAAIVRCEFGDIRAGRAIDHTPLTAQTVDRIHAVDRRLAEAAERAATVSAEELPAFIAAVSALLDERLETLISAGAHA